MYRLRKIFTTACCLTLALPLFAETLEFDGAGNLIRNGQRSMVYNSQNKTVAVSGEAGTGDYIYKDSGPRLRKRFSLTSNPGQTTELLNPTKLITLQQKPGIGRGAVRHIYVNGVRLAAVGADASGNPAIRYYHTDQVSSVKLVTDGKADVVQRHEYRPYGEDFLLPSPRQWGGAGGGVPKFNSQEHDKESGLDFFNARHYDAKLAHFTSADTVIDGETSAAGWNRYLYVHGNPIKYADPSGHGFQKTETQNLTQVWYAERILQERAKVIPTDSPEKHPINDALDTVPLLKRPYMNMPIHLIDNPIILSNGAQISLLNNCIFCSIAQVSEEHESWTTVVEQKIPPRHWVFDSRDALEQGIRDNIAGGQYFIVDFIFSYVDKPSEKVDYHALAGAVANDEKKTIIYMDGQGNPNRNPLALAQAKATYRQLDFTKFQAEDFKSIYSTNIKNIIPEWVSEGGEKEREVQVTYYLTIIEPRKTQ